jgi:hypothetical protein
MWTIESLQEHCSTTSRESKEHPGTYIHMRPMTAWNTFLKLRIKAAWEVLCGRADALKWPEGQ